MLWVEDFAHLMTCSAEWVIAVGPIDFWPWVLRMGLQFGLEGVTAKGPGRGKCTTMSVWGPMLGAHSSNFNLLNWERKVLCKAKQSGWI